MEDEGDTTPEAKAVESPKKVGFWGGLFRFLSVLVVAALIAFFGFAWFTKQSIDSAKEALIELVVGFQPKEVVETFDEWKALKAKATDGNILEIATAEATEKLTRKSNLELYGKTLPLGTTESEILVPATYRFHIDLNDDWKITARDSRLIVISPQVRPTLPVAFDTAKVEKKTKSGWARWDKGANLEVLEKSITKRLSERASSVEVKELIEEEARTAVAKFVQSWLLDESAWGEDEFSEIIVLFPGEETLESSEITLKIEDQES